MEMNCQCEVPPDPMLVFHRVPIDCNTKRDRLRREATHHLVYWSGDEDCGGRDDGAIALYKNGTEAWARALREALDHYGPVIMPYNDEGFTGPCWSRDYVGVKTMFVEGWEDGT